MVKVRKKKATSGALGESALIDDVHENSSFSDY